MKSMKDFFSRYSYESVHLFLNQVAIGLFGIVLALAASKAENEALRIGSSAFAILFFLFLQFSSTWRIGAEDRVSIDLGKRKKDLWVPAKIWLLANSLNLLLAVMTAVGLLFPGNQVLVNVGGVAVIIKNILEGMHVGVLSIKVGDVALNQLWFMHFLTTVPSLIAIYASYLCGLNNINFGGLFSPNAAPKK